MKGGVSLYPDSTVLHRAVWRALGSALALQEDDASVHIFRAYTDAPPAEPPPSETVCYYHLQTSAPSSIPEERAVLDATPIVSSFIPCSLILVFYGPSCEAWAHRCENFLFLDGPDSPRGIHRSGGLYLIPSHPAPSVLFEETGKTRRKRADLVLQARLLSNASYAPTDSPDAPITIPVVTDPPSVSIHLSRQH